MKKLYIISLLSILSLPAFGASATNPFDGITTVDAAWEKFESESQKILDSYKKQLNNKEFKKLKELRTDILKTKPKTQKDKTTEENKTVAERKLTPEEQEQKIAELRDNATAMKEKEQSEANKMLGGTTMAATGVGGMQLASALAEQSADNEAEQDMRAYLATFSCKYGNEHASGGERDIELPGGNELINLYSEYVALANDLKVRKNALGVKPGIESEAILDSAKTGLYDDEGLEPRTGAYASLARALQNPDGEDAKMWAAQREKTAENLKTGATVAGIGAVGGLVANLAINAKAPKERSAEINTKYEKLKQEAEVVQQEIKEQDAVLLQKETCEKYNATGKFNQCTCTDSMSYWDSNNKSCVQCANNETVNEEKNGCTTPSQQTCTLSEPLRKADACECIDNASAPDNTICTCNLTGAFNENTCTCNEHTTRNGNNCECTGDYTKDKDGTTCIPKEIEKASEITTISLNADTLFESGKSTITTAGKKALEETIYKYMADNLLTSAELLANSCLTFSGYTDRSGNHTTNQTLSKQRAETIAKLLLGDSTGNIPNNINNYRIYGKGDTDCTINAYPTKQEYAKCRRVDITIRSGACDGSTINSAIPTMED